MDSNLSSSTEPEIVACPECGGDVSVLRQTGQHWAHRSRILASVTWLLFVLVACGYWASLGTSGYFKSNVDHRETLGSEYRLALTPWAPQTDPDIGSYRQMSWLAHSQVMQTH